jgi:hypothetical protein
MVPSHHRNHTPQVVTPQTFHVDHIVPQALGGQSRLENLCYTCLHCNLHKSDRIQAHAPRTRHLVRLFNPRTDRWDDHLRWSPTYTRLIPRTAIARATIVTLDFNADVFITARTLWFVLGLIS